MVGRTSQVNFPGTRGVVSPEQTGNPQGLLPRSQTGERSRSGNGPEREGRGSVRVCVARRHQVALLHLCPPHRAHWSPKEGPICPSLGQKGGGEKEKQTLRPSVRNVHELSGGSCSFNAGAQEQVLLSLVVWSVIQQDRCLLDYSPPLLTQNPQAEL